MTEALLQPIDAEGVVARLRREFDETFARPPATQPGFEAFLGLRLRDDPYAVRLRQIEGLLSDRRIVPLPTAVAAFAGLTAHRGALVPVYDLGMLLGYPAAASLRWIVTVRASEALLGLAFERFDGHYRLIAAGASPDDRPAGGLLSAVPGLPDGRPLIDIPALLQPILQRESNTKGAMQP
jgi:chemotaxis signal transduction protein